MWRVAVNEGCLLNRRDCALVWQVVEGSGDTTEKRMDWLARHSPRVHGLRPCTSGNCRWTRSLDRSLSLPDGLGVSEAYWRIVLAPRAQLALDYVGQLVRGEIQDRPCGTQPPPRTWGRWQDLSKALAVGLQPLGCEGTLNDGYAYWRDWPIPKEPAVSW